MTVAIPCYNEAPTIAKVVADFRAELPEADIVVVDNASTDESAAQARSAGARVIREKRRGKGFVMQTILETVEGDVLVIVDGDDTYFAEDVHTLLAPVQSDRADMAVGDRLRDASSAALNDLHRFGNRAILAIINLVFRTRFRDVLSGFRVVNRSFLRTVPLITGGFETETELTLQALEKGMIVEEVPIRYRARPSGSYSKLSPFADGYRILITMAVLLRNHRPLYFFSLIALALLAADAAYAVAWTFGRLPDYGTRTHTLVVAGAALAAAGFVFIGVLLNAVSAGFRELVALNPEAPLTTAAPAPAAAAAAAQLESVPCAICGSDSFEIVIPSRRDPTRAIDLQTVFRSSGDEPLQDQMVRCTTCDLHYVRPRLKWELILEGYKGGSDENFVAQAHFRERTFRKSIAKLERLAKPAGRRALDVGAAGGSFLAAARERGYEPLGCEPSTWMCAFARERYGLDLHPGTLFDMPLAAGSIDLLTLWDVIEHTPDPKAVLRRAHELLKDDGVLTMSYPDYGSLAARMLGSRWPFLLTVHLYYFTPATMTALLRASGFEPVGYTPYLQTLELGYVAQRAAPYLGPLGGIGTGTLRALRMHHLPFQYWVGQTMVVARKAPGVAH